MKNKFFVLVALMICAINSYGQGTKLGEKVSEMLRDKGIMILSDERNQYPDAVDPSKPWYKFRKTTLSISDNALKTKFLNAMSQGYNADRDNNNLEMQAWSEPQMEMRMKYEINYAEGKNMVVGLDRDKSLVITVVRDADGTRHLAAVETRNFSQNLEATTYIIEYKTIKPIMLAPQQIANRIEVAMMSGVDSDIVKRLGFFRTKYIADPSQPAPVAGAFSAVEAICNNPVPENVAKAQDIVLDMMLYAKDQKHIEALSKMSAALNEVSGKLAMNGNSAQSNEQLVIIDGVECGKDKIDPSKINSMEVLQGEEAIKKYGDKARNGVITITTKK